MFCIHGLFIFEQGEISLCNETQPSRQLMADDAVGGIQ